MCAIVPYLQSVREAGAPGSDKLAGPSNCNVLDTFVIPSSVQNNFERALGEFFIVSNTPAGRCEHPLLIRALAHLGATSIPRHQINDIILPNLYEERRQQVVSKLQQAQNVMVSMDGWKKGCAGRGSQLINISLLMPTGGSLFWDIINAAGHSKDTQYISTHCEQIMEELSGVASVRVLGFVMDSASANRSALQKLQDAHPHLINLGCLSHSLSLLIKDLAKCFGWIDRVYNEAIAVSNAQATEAIHFMLQQAMLAQPKQTVFSIATHTDTRFGSRHLVLRTVMKAMPALKAMAATPGFLALTKGANSANAKKLYKAVSSIEDEGLPALGHQLLNLVDKIMDAIHQMEADRPLLSRVLPMMKCLEKVAEDFEDECPELATGYKRKKDTPSSDPGEFDTMTDVFHRRLREFVFRDCYASAYVLDPVNFLYEVSEDIWRLPVSLLSASETEAVVMDLHRNGGEVAVDEWNDLLLRNLPSSPACRAAFAKCAGRTEVQKKHATVTMVAEVALRKNVWTNYLKTIKDQQGIAKPLYPTLAGIAITYMSVHATACAPERNWSKWGALYAKNRNRRN
jgi:hypothetical protein